MLYKKFCYYQYGSNELPISIMIIIDIKLNNSVDIGYITLIKNIIVIMILITFNKKT